MKLLYARPSPFVRKVMVMLEEAGHASDVELVDGFGSPVDVNEDVTSQNPVGKIPCLILDDGARLFDSRVICRYLDDRFNLGLYPTGDAQWPAITLEAMADGMLDAAILTVYEIRCRDESERSESWRQGQRDKVSRGLDALENEWLNYLNEGFSIGHIGAACVLEYLDFRAEMGGWPDWRDGRPGLAAWSASACARASMVATRPE